MTDEFVPVVIVGAGPTGLAAANLLGQYCIETLLIERNTALVTHPRAITIDDDGLRVCQALRLADEVLQHVILDVGAEYFSGGQLVLHIEPGTRSNGYPLISTFSQPHLESTLLAGLQRFRNVSVLFGCTAESVEQTPYEVLLTVCGRHGNKRSIRCAYLLACDGGKSAIRRKLRIQMKGVSFPQRWLVVDGFVGTQPAPGRNVSCFYDSARPAVSVPAPHQHWRWEFMLHPYEHEDAFEQSPDSVAPDWFRRLLLQIGDERIPQIVRQSVYTFHAAYANSFADERIFLLGDAAHLLPPFGGQGMNSGLRDALNIAWKLACVLNAQADSRILETYEQERKPQVIRTISYATFLGKHLVMPTGRVHASIRDAALRAIAKLTPLMSSVKEMKIKPASVYDSGLLLKSSTKPHTLAGHQFPQPRVFLPGNRSVLADEVLGSGFALLRLHSNPKLAFDPLHSDLWQRLKARFVCVVPTMEHLSHSTASISCMFDDTQSINRFLAHHRDDLVLIRPDRHILGTFRPEQELSFSAALRNLFGSHERSAVNAG